MSNSSNEENKTDPTEEEIEETPIEETEEITVEEKEISPVEDKSNWIVLVVLFILGAFYAIWHWLKGERAYKADLAKRYGVSTRTLIRWIELFCPKQVQDLYLNNKIQTVLVRDLYSYLGHPEDRPKDGKGRPIVTKSEVCRAFNIEASTLQRKIKTIDNTNEKENLGTTLDIYKSLKHLPPKVSHQLVEFLKTSGLAIKQ